MIFEGFRGGAKRKGRSEPPTAIRTLSGAPWPPTCEAHGPHFGDCDNTSHHVPMRESSILKHGTEKPTGRIYKVLALTFAVMTLIMMLLVSDQSQTIEQQRSLIRKMETNKGCMTATGGNE